jgi:sugar lactone lactonase YvrE
MPPRVAALYPLSAIEGGRITLEGSDFPVNQPRLPDVRVADVPARIVYASSTRLAVVVPPGITQAGPAPVRIEQMPGATTFVHLAAAQATGLHQVDNPVFDTEGNLYVTYSGTRGQQVPVSIFRVRPNGTREPFSTGIVNPTSLAFGPDGLLYVSSRFEGTVYRVAEDGSVEQFAAHLGVACGLAFAPDGGLFVGDRSGTIFRVDREGRAATFASLPSSVAAFHLAFGPDRALYVSGPTLGTYDFIYQIAPDGAVTTPLAAFGRPQGIAFDASGALFVVEALAGSSGLFRVTPGAPPRLVLSGPGLIGLAFDRDGGVVVCSSDTAYRLPNASRALV